MIEILAGWGLVALFAICVLSLAVATVDREDD
jgi:hypothetical protein